MKETIEEIILHYLKFYDNYFYFKNNLMSSMSTVRKYIDLLGHAKTSVDRLNPSACYLVHRYEMNENYTKYKIDILQKNYRNAHSFKAHDLKYLIDIIKESAKYSFCNYTGEDTLENDKILEFTTSILLKEINGEFPVDKNSLIHQIKDKGIDKNITVNQLYSAMEDIIKNHNRDIIEEWHNYAEKLKADYKKFQERGVFIKVDLVHDIYRNESRLFEVNRFSNFKALKTLQDNKANADNMFSHLDVKMDRYIDRITNKYSDKICYFNPFILTNSKFSDGYLKLVNKFEKDAKDLKYSFLYMLSRIQYNVVDMQQYNLSCDLMIQQFPSFPSFLKHLIDNYYELSKVNNKDENLCYLRYFDKHLDQNKLKNYNKISIEDLGCGNFDQKSKIKAEKLLSKILSALLKDKEYTLANMHKTFSKFIIDELRERGIDLNREDKVFIKEIVMYLIFEDLKTHKLDTRTYSYLSTQIKGSIVARVN
ncbi:MAG: hypothetical protein U9N59_09295 [Campylobacterota bacterium]|nr:hypothetical protein [Campylobacterota bacterium]